ncbi:uncharacterized protein LOC114805066 [Zeugodacus cucurbitae]|uniref:uncharacterized protein LOC114805066 n=1 Tax=Zeugodacus cucurbitae TaxID=28588 RepID=UPI0023D8E8B3|nr:uncharacterized protein LOC114805066 [Zeugodacus cucurbitae]
MHTQNFYGVDIEEDLGIPLSYDAAWKIFNRWPREVRVQHQRLGQRTTPSKHTWCFCEEKNCTTRCPLFGFYRKKNEQTENKLNGIMTHAAVGGESGATEYKDVLRSLNKWYNSRCAAGSSQVLDLSKLEQLKIKYKYPAFSLNRKNSSRRFRRRDSRSFLYKGNKYNQPSVTSSKSKKFSRASEEYESSELYNIIENQLRNLSVSQSRLKHMSASLCRLAYAKKQASRTKLRPQIYKRKVVRRYRSDIPIVSNSESTGNTNTSKTSNFCSKSSRNSKSTKSTELSKGSKTSESSKSTKARMTTRRNKAGKSKNSKAKPNESSKIAENKKASKSSKVSTDRKVRASCKFSKDSKLSAGSKTSKMSKTSKTSESSKTSDSYKSINDSKVTNSSKSSDSSRGKGTSKNTCKTGATSKSGAASLSTDTSKRSRTSKSKATSKNSAGSKATNVTKATTISHPIARSIRFNLDKGKRGAARSAGDEEVKCKRKATAGSVMKEHVKVEKPQIQRIGGTNEILNRSNRRPIVAWNCGAGLNRKPTVEAVTKPHSKIAFNHLAPSSCLIRKHYKRTIFIDAGGGGDDVSRQCGRRKITRKPSVRLSKPIMSFFRKQRTISKQSMTMRGKKSRCFLIKGERRK